MNLNEDWANLMFHSDDSLFDEMTKQCENMTDKIEPVRRSSCRSKNKNNKTPPKSTSSPKVDKEVPNDPGSPGGILTVKRYTLRKGTPNKYVHRPLKCTMYDHEVNNKSEQKTHH